MLLSLLLSASIYLLAFSALTAITAVADDQWRAVAGFLLLLRSPPLLSSLLLLLSLLNCFYWRPCYCFLAVAYIHDVNGNTDNPCCFGVPLLLASMLLWHTLLLLGYRTCDNVARTPCNCCVTAVAQHSCCYWHSYC
jgi:hypothetical protein